MLTETSIKGITLTKIYLHTAINSVFIPTGFTCPVDGDYLIGDYIGFKQLSAECQQVTLTKGIIFLETVKPTLI